MAEQVIHLLWEDEKVDYLWPIPACGARAQGQWVSWYVGDVTCKNCKGTHRYRLVEAEQN